MKKNSPTFIQTIAIDYLVQNFFVMIFAGWVIFGIDALFHGKAAFFLVIFAVFLTPLGLLNFFRRYNLITSAFEKGTEIEGKVTKTGTIAKDNIIYYEYNFKGQKYQYFNRVKKSAYAQTLKQSQLVTLLVHEKTPQAAFIKKIYLEYL